MLSRARSRQRPAQPNNIVDVPAVLDDYPRRELPDNQPWYRREVRVNEDRALVFASDRQLQALSQAREVNVDATFRVVPRGYYQLFGIYVTKEDERRRGTYTFPVIYALMSRKTRELYSAVLRRVVELAPDFRPGQVQGDFEEATAGAFRDVFPGVQVVGCWFHYSRAIYRKVQQTPNLRARVAAGGDVEEAVKMLMGLPLLPENLIVEGIRRVEEFLPGDADLDGLLGYVRRQWVGRVGVQRLSVHGQPRRTNNAVESHHAQLRNRFGIAHPGLFLFIDKMNEHVQDVASNLDRLRRGADLGRQRRPEYVANDRRIADATTRLDNGDYTVLQFLRVIRHAVPLQDFAQADPGDAPAPGPVPIPAPAAAVPAAHLPAAAVPAAPMPAAPMPQAPAAPAAPAAPMPAAPILDDDELPDLDDLPPFPLLAWQLGADPVPVPQPGQPQPHQPDQPQANQGNAAPPICLVCLINPIGRFVLIPCGHGHFCIGCMTHLRNVLGDRRCPQCRRPDTTILPIFRPDPDYQ